MICYLVRHGKDDDTVRGGWSQYPLTEEGIQQAEALAAQIANHTNIRIIYSSDLPRAMQSAQIIGEKTHLTVTPLPQFRETNNGKLAGMKHELAQEQYPGLYWNQLGWEQCYPEGESPKQFYERIRAAWGDFSKKILAKNEDVLLVTHGGVMHVILCLVEKRIYSNKEKQRSIPHAAVIPLSYENGMWKEFPCETERRNMERKYYEAYDDRYRQIHSRDLQWFCDDPTPIVAETIREFDITLEHKILELGCGEGRDAYPLLQAGLQVLATDISPAAIAFARKKWPEYAENFAVLDCVAGETDGKFDFIYAVAVVHMLVEDAHRNAFYRFIRKHLTPNGIALICTMGDGQTERQTDTHTAFDLQERTHEQTGTQVQIAFTSCRMVNFETLRAELRRNGLHLLKEGITWAPPDFPVLMYAVVKGEGT